MNNKILFVDDDANLLEGYKRNLHAFFEYDTATSAKEGLEKIIANESYSVVVADMRMPEIDGIKFLSMVKDKDPDIVRIMLTGNADIETAINAVNDGNIFRFLTKPCTPEILKKNIDAAIRQNQLITSEKDLLEKTLLGIIRILSEILSLSNPTAFSRSLRITKLAKIISNKLKINEAFKIEIASMLSHIGCIILPDYLLDKVFLGKTLDKTENETLQTYSKIGFELVSKIPRLEDAGRIIYYQQKNYNGTGYPEDNIKEEYIPLGSRILRVLLDFDTLSTNLSKKETIELLKTKKGLYDPKILEILEEIIQEEIRAQINIINVNLKNLKEKMVLAADLLSTNGKLLLPKGIELTSFIITKLLNNAKNLGIKEPIKVYAK